MSSDDENVVNKVEQSSGGLENPTTIRGYDQSELHPLFWDPGYLPEDPSHPDRVALESFIGEFTPVERATSCKDRGNERLQFALKHDKKQMIREAVESYSQGLAFGVEDELLNSVLYSNRAQAHIHLGNWGNALHDCKWAIKKNPNNIKAYYRGAKCSFNLKDYELSRQFCDQGLKYDAGNIDFKDLQVMAENALEKQTKQQQVEQWQQMKRLKPLKKLAKEIIQVRGLKVTSPQFKWKSNQGPFLDDQNYLHYPVMFVYPETMQQDVIEDVHEIDVISDHLNLMFQDDTSSLEWDTNQEYTRSRIEIYYMANAGRAMNEEQLAQSLQGQWPKSFQDSGPQRYGTNSSTWKLVNQNFKLINILQQSDYVIPGLPVFFVVAKNTAYRDRFLQTD
eukprot:TRINITY_DN4939_c0_g2_i1.p1 TRINITY_DN4939_c0_g2~~TRINITY_DN4939_c0_g2_i1.p1  ORF type:complete len:393 (-),score=32.44 TRINITY_DN4939_c0_g2_i1:375-1553(-)